MDDITFSAKNRSIVNDTIKSCFKKNTFFNVPCLFFDDKYGVSFLNLTDQTKKKRYLITSDVFIFKYFIE